MTEIGSVSRLIRENNLSNVYNLPKLFEEKTFSLPNPKDLFSLSIKPAGSNNKIINFPFQTDLNSQKMNTIKTKVIQSAETEWASGVKENRGSNRGTRVDQYARNAKFSPGYAWCGFFAAFNYSKAGFQYPEKFASYQKARDFFLYRDYVKDDKTTNQKLDSLRKEQKAEGSTRQYFMLKESAGIKYIKNNPTRFMNVDLKNSIFDYKNIPIQAGDVVLFSFGHVGIVESYDKNTGKLKTIEGNATGTAVNGRVTTNAVVKNTYDLSKASDRKIIDGFGRPALGDFKK